MTSAQGTHLSWPMVRDLPSPLCAHHRHPALRRRLVKTQVVGHAACAERVDGRMLQNDDTVRALCVCAAMLCCGAVLVRQDDAQLVLLPLPRLRTLAVLSTASVLPAQPQ